MKFSRARSGGAAGGLSAELKLIQLSIISFIVLVGATSLLSSLLFSREETAVFTLLQTPFISLNKDHPQLLLASSQAELSEPSIGRGGQSPLNASQEHFQPLIGERKWSKLDEEEILHGREGWEHANAVLQNWNNGTLHIDHKDFLKHRQEIGHPNLLSGLESELAWASWVVNPADDQPVTFVPHGPPEPILLPQCKPDLSKYSQEGALAGGVAMCVIARDEGRFLAEWFHYYYHLGARKIVLHDHGSTDYTRAIAERYAPFVDYVDWGGEVNSTYNGQIQVGAYQDCYRRLASTGVTWLGYLDVDELLVFTDSPSQTLDGYLSKLSQMGGCNFPEEEGLSRLEKGGCGLQAGKRVGSVGFNWMLMTSAKVALPEPAFQSLDMPYTFSQDGGDGHHHVKVFVRMEATSAELVTHAHFASLKPGWGQFDAAGEKSFWSGSLQSVVLTRRYGQWVQMSHLKDGRNLSQ